MTLPPHDRRLSAALLAVYALTFLLSAPSDGPVPTEEDVEAPTAAAHFDVLPDQTGPAATPETSPADEPPLPAPAPAAPRVPVVLPRHAPRAVPQGRAVKGLLLAADQDDHFHDEFVHITLSAETTGMMDILRTQGPYVLRVERDGRSVSTVGEAERVSLAYDAGRGAFQAKWPVPWNAPDGEYRPRLDPSPWPEGLPRPDILPFKISSRSFEPVPPGFAVLTLEGYRSLDNIPGPDGVRSIRGFPDWARFIGADALFIQGAESSAFEEKRRAEFPWMTASFDKIRRLGRECHSRGLKLGVYSLCYMLGGPPELSPEFYSYGWNFDKNGLRHGLRLITRRGISITDPRRPGDIVALLKKFQAMPEVDWLGLDYIRPAFGSCELVDDFVAEMPGVATPPGFDAMTPEQRMTWLCRGRYSTADPAKRSEPRFILSDQWFWYRAHRTAEVVRAITSALGGAKPVWAFTLSWNKGWEHGQDPAMMRDAGVDLDAVMLYEADEKMFRGLISHWGAYARRDQLNVIVGNQVDWYLHQKTLNPSGPEAYADRILRAAKSFHTDRKPVRGVFIHDIHRILAKGNRKGPYKGVEWALAAGHAITEIRRMHGTLPYELALEVSSVAAPGEPMTASISFRGAPPEDSVEIRLFASQDLEVSTAALVLSAGNPSASFQARWSPVPDVSLPRGNRAFLSFRAERPGRPEEHPVIRTAYIQGVPHLEPPAVAGGEEETP